jgi:hypothetical protein
MPIYRAPVFEDAHGRAPGVQIGSAVSRALDLDHHAHAEDCGSFFRVHTLMAGLRPGWSLANVADLAVSGVAGRAQGVVALAHMVVKVAEVAEVVVEAVEDAVEHHKEHRAAKKEAEVKPEAVVHTKPEDAEPKKRHSKKKT